MAAAAAAAAAAATAAAAALAAATVAGGASREHCAGLAAPGPALRARVGTRWVPPAHYCNFTEETLATGDFKLLVPVGQALTEVVNIAIQLRLLSGIFWDRGREHMHYWQWAWCRFLDRLRLSAASMPESVRVVSALNTSAQALLLTSLPEALKPILQSLVAGKREMQDGYRAVWNATLITLQLLESAVVLGEEAQRFGGARVSRAVFHGDVPYMGVRAYTFHRADSILSALTGGLGPASATPTSSAPRVAEIGVHLAELGQRLLSRHPRLRWVGVDPYECEIGGSLHDFREGLAGTQVLQTARHALSSWLGGRAQLIIARSTAVFEAELGPEPFDAVFIDGMHDEAFVLADFAFWAPRVRPGGLVAGHDYAFGYGGVVQAVHAALPKGCTLHLAPNNVFWWRHAPPGSNISC